jgi:hypothetical protein
MFTMHINAAKAKHLLEKMQEFSTRIYRIYHMEGLLRKERATYTKINGIVYNSFMDE